jgi:hypothetical protein
MRTILYLCFGGGGYPDELIHAVLAARHTLGAERDRYRIVVYTDDGLPFRDLPVHVETVSRDTLAQWAGPFDHMFRRKAVAIREAMKASQGELLYCDTDTYFLKHPGRVFDRIGPGRSVMHAKEGTPASVRAEDLSAVLTRHTFTTRAGERWQVSPETPILNAGVIGLHETDFPLVDEVIHLIDQICPHLPAYFGTEQFSFSACLSERTQVSTSDDVIHHYWLPTPRARFHDLLARTLHDPSLGSYEDRFRRLLPLREIAVDRAESLQRRGYVQLWHAAHRIGLDRALGSLRRLIGHSARRASTI